MKAARMHDTYGSLADESIAEPTVPGGWVLVKVKSAHV